jgi:hypothetical protein
MRATLMMVLGLALLLTTVGSAMAAGNGKGGGTRDRKRDGSCRSQMTVPHQQAPQLLARYGSGNGKGKGDRKRDGSCQAQASTSPEGKQLLARYGSGNGKGKGDRKRDGSCTSA